LKELILLNIMRNIFLGIGSDLGNREGNLRRAVNSISEIIGPVQVSSSVYESEPWGFRSESMFLNIVVKTESQLSPHKLLEAIISIESEMGRIRTEQHYSSRIIDIDILLMDDLIINEADLNVPHPRMHQRKFVLVPISEIAGDIMHPVFKKSIKTLLEECADGSSLKLYLPSEGK
jgi:2-amino-4-hydroxy-6-hydroxymethyldihydropteridine diphosphokinase